MTEISYMDWYSFEYIFNISRDDIVEVKNIYPTKCKVYLLIEDVKMLFSDELDVNMWYMNYVYINKDWVRSKINYVTFNEMTNK